MSPSEIKSEVGGSSSRLNLLCRFWPVSDALAGVNEPFRFCFENSCMDTVLVFVRSVGTNTFFLTMMLFRHVTTAAIVSWVAMKWFFPVLLSTLASPQMPPGGEGCEGYWPDAEECLKLGTSKPSILRRTRANAGCPQWRIHPNWSGRGEAFSRKLQCVY